MKILVTGGFGFIGSNTTVELLKAGHSVVSVDNLSNSSIDVIDKIKKITNKDIIYYVEDVRNFEKMSTIFKKHKFDAVIHFAGYKAVGESVEQPLMYYENNLLTTINISKLCLKYNVKKIIFSSSATVYGHNKAPFKETMKLLTTTNPYGETKVMCERILTDMVKVNNGITVTILRYFNPIGGHESGMLSEKSKDIPNNLMPYIVKVADGKIEKLSIFGDDFNTIDGTGIRDYIHVTDLAYGHVLALNNNKEGINIYNLGIGIGVSVLQLVTAFENVNKVKIPFDITNRRVGDIDICYADCTKVETELGFKAKYGLDEMCRDSFIRK